MRNSTHLIEDDTSIVLHIIRMTVDTSLDSSS